MEAKLEIKFQCPECKTIIEHNYTEKDLLNNTCLDFTCQECNYFEQVKTSVIIEKAKQKVVKELQKKFK